MQNFSCLLVMLGHNLTQTVHMDNKSHNYTNIQN